jgi:hypothetical protein
MIFWFYTAVLFEGVHPLESGVLRLKFRSDRRYGMPIENPLRFYPRYLAETLSKVWGYYRLDRRLRAILNEVLAAPDRERYSDLAIAPQADDLEVLDLYHATTGGEAALARKRRDDGIREAVHQAHAPAAASA